MKWAIWLPNLGTVSLAGKHLLTHLCCKLLCYRIILMEGIPMYARSKFMDLDRASSTYLCTISCSPVSDYKYTDWTTPPPLYFIFFSKCSLQEPFSASAFSIYFKRVHYVLLCEMRNMTLPTKEKNCETVSRGEVKHVAESSQSIEEWWRVSSWFPMSINYGVHISIIVEEKRCITWFSSGETYPVSDCLTLNWSKAAWIWNHIVEGFSLSLVWILTFWESHGYKMLLLCLKIEAIIIIFQVLRAGGTKARDGTWNSLFVPHKIDKH